LILGEEGGLVLVNEPFVCREDATRVAVHQGRETLDVMRAGCQ
jgi:hypothetical protein